MSGLDALAKLLKLKKAAIEAQGYTPKAWFHGTNTEVIPSERSLWLAEDPMVASLYTGGGRRAGPGTAKSGGRLYPFVAKENSIDTGLYATEPIVPEAYDEILQIMGVKDTRDFRERVKGRAKVMAEEMEAHYPSAGYLPTFDEMGYVGGRNPRYEHVLRSFKPYELFDRKPFNETIVEEMGPDVSYEMQHPSTLLRFGKRGQVLSSPETINATVLVAPRGEGALKLLGDFRRGGRV